jgi:hypothetical protein
MGVPLRLNQRQDRPKTLPLSLVALPERQYNKFEPSYAGE